MSIFGNQGPKPTRINEVQINQANQGYPVPWVMGKFKIQQSILWVDGFSSKQVSQGGKGFSGKGGNQYVYSADVLAALCAGPILGVADVWSGQSWLSNTNGADSIVISSSPYTPTAGAAVTADHGVYFEVSYSQSVTDLGQNPQTLAGTMLVPLQFVPWPGSAPTLTTGQYSINPSTGNYYFALADIGKTVSVNYTFALAYIKKQLVTLVPAGLNVPVGGSIPFYADGGGMYYSGGLAGTLFRRVSGTPTVAGTYSVSGSGPATYHFATPDINAEILITYKLNNSSALAVGTQKSLAFTLFEGFKGQSPWALLSTNFPGAALGYTGIALVAYGPMDLGYGAQIQQNVFEVLTPDAWGGGIPDCNPVQCIRRVLTDAIYGLGRGKIPFPTSAIDSGSGGSWGSGMASGAARAESTATAWFAANGFFISPAIDRQDTAASAIGRWLEAGWCAAFWSEGLFKLVPYGDTSVSGNGCTWIAPQDVPTVLDDTCFIPQGKGKPPVKISSSPWTEAWNTVQIRWSNRANQYSADVTPETDQAAADRYGDRTEDPQDYPFITTLTSATFAANFRLKRSVYTRNTYEFELPVSFAYLEPMDVVPITTDSPWGDGTDNTLGLINYPVRIIKIVDTPTGKLQVTAEDYPPGVHVADFHAKGLTDGTPQQNQFADPGDAEIVVFVAPQRLSNYQNQIWMGAAGVSEDWGGCRVFASMDGTTYDQIGEIDAPSRIGNLVSVFPVGSDPDTVNNLVVKLVSGAKALENATTADADQANTLCFVDEELISYSACALTAEDTYTMSGYIRRGIMGSTITSCAMGSSFLRLDNNIVKWSYDPSWAGKTIFLKFQAVNRFGNSAQDLSALSAIVFDVPADATSGSIDPSTGVLTLTHGTYTGGIH